MFTDKLQHYWATYTHYMFKWVEKILKTMNQIVLNSYRKTNDIYYTPTIIHTHTHPHTLIYMNACYPITSVKCSIINWGDINYYYFSLGIMWFMKLPEISESKISWPLRLVKEKRCFELYMILTVSMSVCN